MESSSSNPRLTWPSFHPPTRKERQNLTTYIYIEDPSPTSPTSFLDTSKPKTKLTTLLARTGVDILIQKAKDAAYWRRIKRNKVKVTFKKVDYTGRRGGYVRWARRELNSIPASPLGAPDFAMARREFQRMDGGDRLYDQVYRGDENRLRALLDLEGDYPEGRRQMPFSDEDLDAIDFRLHKLRQSEQERRERSWRGRIKWPRW